ncbi:MAG: hypothetical protein ACHQT9_03045, partial [Candidatus Saccharimonadales bacterium]
MKKGNKLRVFSLILLVLVIAGYVSYCLLRPIQLVLPQQGPKSYSLAGGTSLLTWPGVGQSAVGILGNNQISVHGALTPTQTASVAKLITSLVVLKVKPLLTNQQGETIT